MSYERTYRRIVCRLIELVESVRRVTTSGVVNPSGPPSTVNCRRRGVELSIGRCAVVAPHCEGTTCRASASPLFGRRQPFHDAVVVGSGAVARGRRENAPTCQSRAKDRALTPGSTRSRSHELTLLLPLLYRATVVHVAAYVLC